MDKTLENNQPSSVETNKNEFKLDLENNNSSTELPDLKSEIHESESRNLNLNIYQQNPNAIFVDENSAPERENLETEKPKIEVKKEENEPIFSNQTIETFSLLNEVSKEKETEKVTSEVKKEKVVETKTHFIATESTVKTEESTKPTTKQWILYAVGVVLAAGLVLMIILWANTRNDLKKEQETSKQLQNENIELKSQVLVLDRQKQSLDSTLLAERDMHKITLIRQLDEDNAILETLQSQAKIIEKLTANLNLTSEQLKKLKTNFSKTISTKQGQNKKSKEKIK